MTLLFVTQKLHEQDHFVLLWIRAFQERGYTVNVLCLEDRVSPQEFKIFSLGKEHSVGKIRQVFTFWKYITSLHYDRVFVHMAPVYGALGSWWWMHKRIPTYLWYTHYKRSLSVRIVQAFAKRIFCATAQSVPWLCGNPQKVVVGHGIDMNFWKKRKNTPHNPKELLLVHRLSRSKRVEIVLHALAHLPAEFTAVIYGIEAEKEYVKELHDLVSTLSLEPRVRFMGTTSMESLPAIYSTHQLIINMAPETIDKTMLEAMTCGCFPVITPRNAKAIGLPFFPQDDTPQAVAQFVQDFTGEDADTFYGIVESRHSLSGLITRIDEYIANGR